MIHIKYFEHDIDYHGFMVGNNIELPNVSFTDDENVVYYNPIAKKEILKGELCDVVLYDTTLNKKVIVNIDDLNSNDYPSNQYTPIGVVVIPASHNVYGTGECGVMSLKGMSCTNPDMGGNDSLMCWGKYDIGAETEFKIEELRNLDQTPLIDSSNNIIGTTIYNGAFPSSMISSNRPLVGSGMDIMAGYDNTLNMVPSPYLEDGSRNPVYYSTDGSINEGLLLNCLSDFNGKENTDIILKYATSQSNWKTDAEIIDAKELGYYPAACCCWRYHTEGTKQGEWYLPSIGELGYHMVRYMEIQNAFEKIASLYGSDSCYISNSRYGYWTSSERSNNQIWTINHFTINLEYMNTFGTRDVISFIRL